MSPNAYTELALVEAAAMEVLAALDWPVVSAVDETFGPGGTLGRESERDVALVGRLRAALAKLNPGVPAAALDLAVDELLRDRIAMGPAAANQEVHDLLTEGVKLSLRDDRTGRQEPRTLRVVDWERPSENDFLAVEQLALQGPLYRCIPDVVLFVNGLPWVVIELKRPGVSVRQAFDENLTSYQHPQNGVPRLFAFNALLVASNGTEAKVGSLTADWGRFFDWKPLAPLAFFGAIIILSAAGFVTPWLAAVGGALAASYLGADIFFAARVAARRGGRGFPSAFGLFPALHVGYALGMVEGFWAAYIRHMSAAEIRRRGVHCGLTR